MKNAFPLKKNMKGPRICFLQFYFQFSIIDVAIKNARRLYMLIVAPKLQLTLTPTSILKKRQID